MRILNHTPQWLGLILLSIFSNAARAGEGAVSAEYKWITFAVFGMADSSLKCNRVKTRV